MRISDWSSDVCSSDLFSITIATAMTLSVLVAIMFTPALCATILRQTDVDHSEQNRFFRWFNRRFNASSESYGRGVAGILKRKKRFLVLYGVLLLVLGALFMRLPTARSEEHTSELQSLMRISYAVFCLKKKTK